MKLTSPVVITEQMQGLKAHETSINWFNTHQPKVFRPKAKPICANA